MSDLPPTDAHDTFSHRLAFALVIPLAILLVAVLTTFFGMYSTAYVDGLSMEPTLLDNELVLVTRGYEEPRRGDIVVVDVSVPGVEEGVLVKRIVAVPGDEIEVVEGEAYVNGEKEKGGYTVYIACCDLSVDPLTVPDGQVFLLGDNRPISEDSRIFGTVPFENIEGKVVAVLKPIEEARRVD